MVLFSLLAPHGVQAQLSEVRGTVVDSATAAPVPAAVVTLLDASSATLVRTLTNDRGQYRLLRPAEATQMRVVRLGFEPQTVPLAQAKGRPEGGYTLDVRLAPFARALQGVDVVAARGCEQRGNQGAAFVLLDAARAGLLATEVAREKDPPRLVVLRFERLLDGDGIETVRQTVRVDSSEQATVSFSAVQTAADFLATGFRGGRAGDYMFFSPDAGVILDERFQAGYCFSVAAADANRATQVGLRFTPATRKAGRVDIDGTLWIDTVARALSEITFRYVGVEPLAEGLGAGGRIGFRSLPNGVPFIDRWQLRMVDAPATDPADPRPGPAFIVRETGGELAEARWPDGRVWHAPLGSVHITAVGAGSRPAAGVVLRLAGTEYLATTNADGRASMQNLLPGPYRLVVDDPYVRSIGMTIPTGKTFTAVRGSALLARVEVQGPLVLAQSACKRTDAPKNNESWILGRAFEADGNPAADVRWQLLEADNGRWKPRTDIGVTGTDGVIALCRGQERGRTVELTVWRPGARDTVRVRKVLDGPLELFPARLPSARLARNSGSSITIAGVVRDSASGAAVPEARVHLVDTPFETVADEEGRFVLGGFPAGRYLVEVGTKALDPLGIVARRDLTLRDGMPSLTLGPPQLAESLGAACRGLGGTGSSLIVGRLAAAGDGAALAGYRVVAEWETDTSTLLPTDSLGQSRMGGWIRAIPDPTSGVYRLCDAPVGRRLTVRAEADTMSAGASTPQTLVLAPKERVARLDLALQAGLVVAPTYSGTVVDSVGGMPVEGAEVTITDLGRSTLTNRRGQFRFSGLPTGPHLVSVRSVGFAKRTATITLQNARALDERVLVAPATAQSLAAVEIRSSGVPTEFEERRKLGLGSYITRPQLDSARGQRLGTVMAMVKGMGTALSNMDGGAHAYVVGKRAPSHLLPRGSGVTAGPDGARQSCGVRTGNMAYDKANTCTFTFDDIAQQGYYCPTPGERARGMTSCQCFAQVYLDDRIMNSGRPTEPFDVNTIPIDQIAGVEFYPSPSSTPARYSTLNSVCGVMLIWTRRP
ncbi:MAG: carboxypeptidase regulatory-like domain-containing protein [Gemmatimonadaceae bacterium]|nr:carboxypeptidase regulatory-like domain-containing protein [Gemmatimonadaceae bacterium]